jgi:hypothetical protein
MIRYRPQAVRRRNAADSSDAAAFAMADAGVTWGGPHSPAGQADLE